MNKIALLATLVAIFVLPLAMAAQPGGATVQSSTDQGVYPAPNPGSVNVQAGHTYLTNLTTEQSTYHWAGIFGNVTGKIVLGDENNFKMFSWDAIGQWVYASTASALDWTNSWSAATCSVLDSAFSFLTGASDDCAHTFTTTDNFTSEATGQSVTNTIEAQTYDNTTTAYWKTMAAQEGSSPTNVVFIAPVETGHKSFNNQTVQYQMILPENGGNGDTSPTQYYLWVELK